MDVTVRGTHNGRWIAPSLDWERQIVEGVGAGSSRLHGPWRNGSIVQNDTDWCNILQSVYRGTRYCSDK